MGGVTQHHAGGMEGATVGRHAQSFQGIAPAEQEGQGVTQCAIGWEWSRDIMVGLEGAIQLGVVPKVWM